jgi:hypothetical protein
MFCEFRVFRGKKQSPTELAEFTEPSAEIYSHGIHGIRIMTPTDSADLHRTFEYKASVLVCETCGSLLLLKM